MVCKMDKSLINLPYYQDFQIDLISIHLYSKKVDQ